MSGFSFGTASCASNGASSVRPGLPIIAQARVVIRVGQGATFTPVFTQDDGECAVSAGSVFVKGCNAVRFAIGYVRKERQLDGSVTVVSDITSYDVPAGGAMDLPAGLIDRISVQALTEFQGISTFTTEPLEILWTSSYQPDDCGCIRVATGQFPAP